MDAPTKEGYKAWVYVKTMDGKTIDIDGKEFDWSSTILQVKNHIQQAEGIPVEDQILIKASKQLNNTDTFQSINLEKGQVINLMIKKK